jgi:RNA polymerase sigma-70 factor, ECF subfamily
MVAAQQGDAEAYEALLRELLPVVRQRVRRRIGAAGEVEDTVQNVLISLHRARQTYRPEQPFRPWLNAIVRNASIDALRRRARRSRFEGGGDPEQVADHNARPTALAGPRGDESGLGDERLSPDLASALATLPAGQREAVELIQLEGLSVAEAAERVGTSPGALKVRAHRGYRALRALLRGRE